MFTLKNILRTNAISCLAFGLLFILMPLDIVNFLSLNSNNNAPFPEIVLQGLGVVLIFNGLHLLWASTLKKPNKFLIYYFSMGDFLWTAGTVVLLGLGIWITTTVGIIASVIVALMVTLLGILQLLKLKTIKT